MQVQSGLLYEKVNRPKTHKINALGAVSFAGLSIVK